MRASRTVLSARAFRCRRPSLHVASTVHRSAAIRDRQLITTSYSYLDQSRLSHHVSSFSSLDTPSFLGGGRRTACSQIRPLSTKASVAHSESGPADAEADAAAAADPKEALERLHSETDALLALLQPSASSSAPAQTPTPTPTPTPTMHDVLSLMSQWSELHSFIKANGLDLKKPTKLGRWQWSDRTDETMQAIIRCAERTEELLRYYNENTAWIGASGGGIINGNGSGTGDAGYSNGLEPYRLSMHLWSQTPTVYSGDRAAAILDLWGSKYGGDMSKQPTINEFDVVLESYALSATVHGGIDSDTSIDVNGSTGTSDGATSSRLVEYPEDRALSTLRLLRNLGDMYLVPTVSTVSHVVQALRRASRTPRGQGDGRNKERTRTVVALLRDMEEEASHLFDDSGDQDDTLNQRRCHYLQACCDAFTMASRSLPMQEAVDETKHWLNEIDRRAFGVDGTHLSPSFSGYAHIIDSCCNYTIRVWRDRALSYDDDITASASPSDKLNHIRLAARAADDIIAKLQKWEDVKLTSKQCRRVANTFCLSTHPSIVNDATGSGAIDTVRDVVPLVQRAEELALEASRVHHEKKVDVDTFIQLIGSWTQLSGVVLKIPGPIGGGDGGFFGSRPADRAEDILRAMVRQQGQNIEEQNVRQAYNYAIAAWAKSRTGKLGAKKALALFEAMCGTGTETNDGIGLPLAVHAQPDERTYAGVLKALRYAHSWREAQKAEALLITMVDESTICPNARHFGTVIAALTRSGHHEAGAKAKKLLKTLLTWYHESNDNIDLRPDTFMFSDVITAIGRTRNDRHKVLKVSNLLRNLQRLYQITGSDSVKPNVNVYGAAIGALASAKGEDALQMVEDLLDEMKSNSIEPNKVCYSSVITAHSRNGCPEEAELILKEMDTRYEETGDDDIRPNSHAFNAVINAWSRVASSEGVKRSRALLDEMLDRYSNGDEGLKPTSRTFTAMINALWKSGEENATLEAEELLQMMEEHYADGNASVAPDTYTYTSVINTWARSNAPNKAARALALLRRAREQFEAGNVNAQPDVSMYTAVLNACAYTKGTKEEQADALRIALEVAEELDGSLQADSISYNTLVLVYGYLVADEQEQARLSSALLQRCCQDGLLNSQILSTMKKFVPMVYYKLPGAYDGFVKIGNLPEQWSRNAHF